jgi:hypothetical protein
LSLIGNMDPYESEWLDDVDLWLWPSITSVNIAMYLLFTQSPYTGNDLLNYKSINCYNNFLPGWVREILVKVPKDDVRLIIAKVSWNNKINCHLLLLQVNHSQRMSEKPLPLGLLLRSVERSWLVTVIAWPD